MAKEIIVLLVIDGLGIGPMSDAKVKGNTWKTILKFSNSHQLPQLKKLIAHAKALNLDYQGADSFLGHLTLSGVDLKQIQLLPLAHFQKKIIKALVSKNYHIRLEQGLIIVNEAVIIGDNFEAEHGLAINLTGCRDLISQIEQTKIAKIVRQEVTTTRVISFGAKKMSIANYCKHIIREKNYVGLNTPATGVYNETYDVIHLAKKIDFQSSMQAKLINHFNYQVYLLGKFADIINLEGLTINYSAVKTQDIFDKLFYFLLNLTKNSFFCINIQETDLAGHSLDVKKYIETLTIIEKNFVYLKQRYPQIKWIITSDHGNDPGITSSNHTREKVPLIYLANNQIIKPSINNLSQVATFIINLTKKIVQENK